jgi:hypothetical protein
MSASATSRTAARFPRRSSTDNAVARPDACSALRSALYSSATGSVITAQPTPIGPASSRNQLGDTSRPHIPTFLATLK